MNPDDQAAYRVNTAALTRYLDQLREVESDANPTMRIDLGSLLQLPGVCEPPALEDICEKTQAGLMALVDQAVANAAEMRRVEGESLVADMAGNCDVVGENLEKVVERAPTVVQEYHERLRQRVEELTRAGQVNLDKDTLAREVAVFAERCDVAEEISRLREHLKQFRKTMSAGENTGRKLDFIAQEMLREANTIGSKGNDSQIAQAVVEIKTGIDRIKEQVQNVE